MYYRKHRGLIFILYNDEQVLVHCRELNFSFPFWWKNRWPFHGLILLIKATGCLTKKSFNHFNSYVFFSLYKGYIWATFLKVFKDFSKACYFGVSCDMFGRWFQFRTIVCCVTFMEWRNKDDHLFLLLTLIRIHAGSVRTPENVVSCVFGYYWRVLVITPSWFQNIFLTTLLSFWRQRGPRRLQTSKIFL